jgi:hypothetical protein
MPNPKKAIITTTINPPTKALLKFADIAKNDDWHLFIVGDKKTPHDAYNEMAALDYVTYITPEDQEGISQELSDLIGWNCIQRRNFGLIAAYRWGAEIIATIDDDNIPVPTWGKNVKVGQEFGVSTFKWDLPVFDPMAPAFPSLWHRGFPVQLLNQRHIKFKPQLLKRRVLVQADLWDGDPDIDAICRIGHSPNVKFNPHIIHFAGNKPSPFNSQNTFLSREIIRDYFLFPHIGRMDDIWAAYYVQALHPDCVAYYKATVFQERNEHDLVKDLKAEMIGYEHTLELIEWLYETGPKNPEPQDWPAFMPREALDAFVVYQKVIDGDA